MYHRNDKIPLKDGVNMFSEKLKDLRKRTKKNQEEVANDLGLTRSNYSHFENGRNQPDNETLVKLANYYNVTTDYLLGHDVPDWATQDDIIDLEEMLNSNVNMAYGGENLTEEEKQRVKDVLTGIFWEKIKDRKK